MDEEEAVTASGQAYSFPVLPISDLDQVSEVS